MRSFDGVKTFIKNYFLHLQSNLVYWFLSICSRLGDFFVNVDDTRFLLLKSSSKEWLKSYRRMTWSWKCKTVWQAFSVPHGNKWEKINSTLKQSVFQKYNGYYVAWLSPSKKTTAAPERYGWIAWNASPGSSGAWQFQVDARNLFELQNVLFGQASSKHKLQILLRKQNIKEALQMKQIVKSIALIEGISAVITNFRTNVRKDNRGLKTSPLEPVRKILCGDGSAMFERNCDFMSDIYSYCTNVSSVCISTIN